MTRALPAVLVAGGLACLADDAAASSVRQSAGALGALAVLATLLVVREWPMALTGSLWAAGTLLAAAVWLLRTRPLTEWLPPVFGTRPRLRPWIARPASRASVAPVDPEADAVLQAARRCFVELQQCWDAADTAGLAERTTPEMLRELLDELPRRGPGPNRTDVVTLEAELIAMERLGARELASVAFSGLIRESAGAPPMPFREVWMLTREPAGDWRLARHQALI